MSKKLLFLLFLLFASCQTQTEEDKEETVIMLNEILTIMNTIDFSKCTECESNMKNWVMSRLANIQNCTKDCSDLIYNTMTQTDNFREAIIPYIGAKEFFESDYLQIMQQATRGGI